jgi:hypothetical protein
VGASPTGSGHAGAVPQAAGLTPAPGPAGLDRNDYNKSKCLHVFDAYKSCRDRLVRGGLLLLLPRLPDAERPPPAATHALR